MFTLVLDRPPALDKLWDVIATFLAGTYSHLINKQVKIRMFITTMEEVSSVLDTDDTWLYEMRNCTLDCIWTEVAGALRTLVCTLIFSIWIRLKYLSLNVWCVHLCVCHHIRPLGFFLCSGRPILSTRPHCYDNTIVNFSLDGQSVDRPFSKKVQNCIYL